MTWRLLQFSHNLRWKVKSRRVWRRNGSSVQLLKRNSRRSWLAAWLQDRRRKRKAAVRLELWSDGHGHLNFSCSVYAPYGLSICHSTDGITWNDYYDGVSDTDTSRDASGDPGYFRVARTDGSGFVMLPYSNVVYSDGL